MFADRYLGNTFSFQYKDNFLSFLDQVVTPHTVSNIGLVQNVQ